VRAFQGAHGLVADGVVGPRTEAALRAAGAGDPPLSGGGVPPGPRPNGDGDGPTTPGSGCPEPAHAATERCTQPGSLTCPAIPNLLCLREVAGVPFEYPLAWGRDHATGLGTVARRSAPRTQRFVPSVRDALNRWIADMRRFGLPLEAIITQGSLVCRCISGTNTLSNHSFGDAIDVAGVRWPPVGGPASRARETLVRNFPDPGERALLRRMDACLRLHFATVIDYNYNADHRDHFHCDMNRGQGRILRGRTTIVFVQEVLAARGARLAQSGRLDNATVRALAEAAGVPAASLRDDTVLRAALDSLFTAVASGQ